MPECGFVTEVDDQLASAEYILGNPFLLAQDVPVKVEVGEAGSGMHFYQHLFKGEENCFFDPCGYGLMSNTALRSIGGLLHHGPALLALTSPSTNSYRRLVPGYEAPVNALFSIGNRSAAVRIPRYATDPKEARIEFRPPDATCNVHLALAAQLMAGIDGVLYEIDPAEAGFGPIDADILSWSDQT